MDNRDNKESNLEKVFKDKQTNERKQQPWITPKQLWKSTISGKEK